MEQEMLTNRQIRRNQVTMGVTRRRTLVRKQKTDDGNFKLVTIAGGENEIKTQRQAQLLEVQMNELDIMNERFPYRK